MKRAVCIYQIALFYYIKYKNYFIEKYSTPCCCSVSSSENKRNSSDGCSDSCFRKFFIIIKINTPKKPIPLAIKIFLSLFLIRFIFSFNFIYFLVCKMYSSKI